MPRAHAIAVLYVLFASKSDAISVSKALLQERLIACANILPASVSLFPWHGAIRQAKEVPVVYKTSRRLALRAKKRIAQLHAYECPCILELGACGCPSAYAKWVEDSVTS